MHRSSRPLAVAATLWFLLCLAGCPRSGTGAQAGASVPASPTAEATPVSASASYTVSVGQASPATIAQEKLTLGLTDVKDSRCPVGVQCIWAGHAAVTLAVSQDGGPPQPVVIGTEAPDNLKLPFKATHGPFTLSLVKLEPTPTKEGGVPLPRYVATVQVTRH